MRFTEPLRSAKTHLTNIIIKLYSSKISIITHPNRHKHLHSNTQDYLWV